MAKKTITADELFKMTSIDRVWLVAARGRWQSGDTLCNAIRILGEKPEAGIMQVSHDYTVDSMFGGVTAAHVTSFELDPDELDKVMNRVVTDMIIDVQDQMCFVSEYLDTTEVDKALDALVDETDHWFEQN